MQPVKALLEAKRAAAHKSLMHGLDSPRYERFKTNMAAQLRHPSKWPAKADRKARKVVPELLESFYRRARKQGDALDADAPPADYHQVRIKLKSVRYCLEFIKGLYGKPAKRMLKRVEKLVDLLGEYHDMQVAIQLYHDWRAAPPQELPAEALPALDTLAWRSNAHADELKAQFPDLYAQVKGKDWKRLHREMV
jgi:CHAD domain-containing protein